MANKILIIFKSIPHNIKHDIEIPIDITVEELIFSLKKGFNIDWKDEYVLRAENPECALDSDEFLANYQLHDGSVLILDNIQSGGENGRKSSSADAWNESLYNYPQYIKNVRQQYQLMSAEINVLPPEAAPQEEKKNVLLMVMPMIVSLVLTIGLRGIMGNGGMFIVYSIAMMGMSSIITLINYRNDNKKREEKKKERTEKYLRYIKEKDELIRETQEKERIIANRKYTSVTEKIKFVKDFNNRLFEKRKNDEDFLTVCVGEGIVRSRCEVKIQEPEFKELNDPLAQCPEALSNKYKYLDKMPVTLDLKSVNAVGIVGNRTKLYQMAKNLLLSVAIEHYYNDVKLFFIMEEVDIPYFSWIRWFQNMRDESTGIRNLMFDDASAKYTLEYLYAELARRESLKGEEIALLPHHVVFVYRTKRITEHPVSEFVKKAAQLGFSFIFFEKYEELLNENCDKRILLNPNSNEGYIQDVKNGESVQYFHYPHLDKEDARRAALKLSCVYVDEVNLESSLTKEISLFELLRINNIKQVNVGNNWNKASVYDSLAAPIGVKSGGEMVSLDLHEKYHGPHGLVAGTTGSGKSEILQTYILSMAMLFHPHDVSFVIIDFKGGGMVNQFKNLPHLIGAITNIDGREIDRSLKSIKAELLKRQALFAQANVNHIDKYIKLYKEGQVSVALPHLIIIVDEFAELRAEQPEFMKELISASRIGRSLGVHLILATQKPSGQVSEQIWSNSKFKICLKVQTKGDSNEVIKSPLAAEIKEPGRAYIQVGNNEIFELIQSAYSGASATAKTDFVKEYKVAVVELSGKRSVIFEQKNSSDKKNIKSQLEVMVDYIAEQSEELSINRLSQICLPPLEDVIDISMSSKDYTLEAVPVGIYDNPDMQYQGEVKFNFSDENTLIVGASATGKTNFLQTIIRQIAERFSPNEANIYILDFGTMYLKNFEKLSHVGGVVTISEEEKLKNLLKLLNDEIERRKEMFLNMGISSYAAYRETGENKLPQIYVLVDNFTVFKEVYTDPYEGQLMYIAREGLASGISVIVTSTQVSRFGFKYLANFAQRIAFHCNDSTEYASVFERCKMSPKEVPGRALCKIDKVIYEFQAYLPFEGEKEIERSENIKHFINEINTKYGNSFAKRIPEIPDILTYDNLASDYILNDKKNIYPIGLDYENVEVAKLDFNKNIEWGIVGNEQQNCLQVLKTIFEAMEKRDSGSALNVHIIDNIGRALKDKAEKEYVKTYTIDFGEVEELLKRLVEDMNQRYEMLVNEGIDSLVNLPLQVVIVNNKDAIEHISSNKAIMEIYNTLTKKYKSLGICFIYSDIENEAVAYGGPEILKRLKESKKMLIAVQNLKEFKFCDVPPSFVRTTKPLKHNDAYLLTGTAIQRVKLIDT